MSTDLTLFHFDDNRENFEDKGQPNGTTRWSAEDLMEALGYSTYSSFENAILRAKTACLALKIDCEDHFHRNSDGKVMLTRFGCYLVAMNGDTKKPQVAAAQMYFAAIAETFQSHLEHADGMDRLLIRGEITDGHKSLASTAKRHGVEHYGYFQHQGYMGMYNMPLKRLEELKGVKEGQCLIDRMGKAEMAAHLFRITQTDEKIKNENIRGQDKLEKAAHDVGRTVRKTMQEVSGTAPENLPPAENIKEVRKAIKGTRKKLDKPKKKLDKPS